MSLKRDNLMAHFNGIQCQKETLIFDDEILHNLEQKYKNSLGIQINKLDIKKSYGIFAITDSLFSKYGITSFHYVDFRWFSAQMTAKIMHKAHIEELDGNNGFSMKFSKSPYQYSGEVCGLMRGDYRDCFKAIKEKEQLHQLLYNGSIELPDKQNIKIKIQCGLGLESLTTIEIISNPQHLKLDLLFID